MDRTDQDRAACPVGMPSPAYTCRFCHHGIHRGDSGCDCSQFRPAVTSYASLCTLCAEAVDVLTADTVLGRVHRSLIYDAELKFVQFSGDA